MKIFITVISFSMLLISLPLKASIRVCVSSAGEYSENETGTLSGLPYFEGAGPTPGKWDCSPILTVDPYRSCRIELPRGRVFGTLYTYSSYVECSLDGSYSILILLAVGGFGIYRIRGKNL